MRFPQVGRVTCEIYLHTFKKSEWPISAIFWDSSHVQRHFHFYDNHLVVLKSHKKLKIGVNSFFATITIFLAFCILKITMSYPKIKDVSIWIPLSFGKPNDKELHDEF